MPRKIDQRNLQIYSLEILEKLNKIIFMMPQTEANLILIRDIFCLMEKFCESMAQWSLDHADNCEKTDN